MDISREQWEELQRLTLSADPSSKEADDPAEAVTARVRALLTGGLLPALNEVAAVTERVADTVTSAVAAAAADAAGAGGAGALGAARGCLCSGNHAVSVFFILPLSIPPLPPPPTPTVHAALVTPIPLRLPCISFVSVPVACWHPARALSHDPSQATLPALVPPCCVTAGAKAKPAPAEEVPGMLARETVATVYLNVCSEVGNPRTGLMHSLFRTLSPLWP
jgi:hypothetical protein